MLIYGGPTTWKTLAAHTLPPPVLVLDFEGGDCPLTMWLRRTRKAEGQWVTIDKEERELAFKLLTLDRQAKVRFPPYPFIDIISYNTQEHSHYNILMRDISNIKAMGYNSVVVDSVHELAIETQTYSKGPGEENLEKTMQETGKWAPAQERVGIILRNLRALRDSGIFIYATCSEQIDKDYVEDPRAGGPKQEPFSVKVKQEPFSVKGAPNVPGKIVSVLQHVFDVQLRSRFLGETVIWVSKPELISKGSGAYWEVKERTGRVRPVDAAGNPTPGYHLPDCRRIIADVYGGMDAAKAIYDAWLARKEPA
jgi:hypothetical protein